MRDPHTLISKLVSIDTLSTSSILVCNVTSLHHEIWNDPMENIVLVTQPFVSWANGPKVLCSLRNVIIKELKYHSSLFIAFFTLISNSQIEESLWVGFIELWHWAIFLSNRSSFLRVKTAWKDWLHFLLLVGQSFTSLLLNAFKLVSQIFVSWT